MPNKKGKKKGSTIRKPRSGRPGIIGFFDDNSLSKAHKDDRPETMRAKPESRRESQTGSRINLIRESTEAEYNPLRPTIELRRPKYRESFFDDGSFREDRKDEQPESRRESQSEQSLTESGADEGTDKWSREAAAKYMMGGVGKTLEVQNTANAVVWYNTMFSGNETLPKSEQNPDQELVLREQQDFLKRHFLAMAVLGLDAGDQDKNAYRPLEELTDEGGERVNLATVSSGGGRLNYRSTDGTGDDFKNFLFFGSAKPKPLIEGKIGKQPIGKGKYSKTLAGAYDRVSTHNESFKNDGRILEESNKFGKPAIGLSIPIGGVGQKLRTPQGQEAITGYQGKSVTKDGKAYQTGAGLIRHATKGQLSNTMVAFEGSAPHEDNILGGSHGAIATLKKVVGTTKSKFTLTGQGKRSTWGLSQKLPDKGSIKVDVTQDSLKKLKDVWNKVKSLDAKPQQEFYQKLLETTTQKERNALVDSLG